MTTEQFGRTIKQKYPQYSDLPDAEIGQKMLDKYPQYSDMIDSGYQSPEEKPSLIEQLKQQPVQNPAQAFGSSLLGAAKGVGSTIYEMGKFGAETLGRVPRAITGQGFTPAPVMEKPKFLESKNLQELSGFIPEQLGEFLIPGKAVTQTQKILTKGAKLLPKGMKTVGKLAGIATPEAIATGAVSAIQGMSKEEIDRNILLGAGIPIAGRATAGAVKFAKDQAPRVMNSLIKPLSKDFSYGKNPGKAVAEEGIVGNSLDELAQNIKLKKEEYGKKIASKTSASTQEGKILDVSDAIKAIDTAEATAMKAPRTNTSLINRLQDARKDLLKVTTNEVGEDIVGRDLSKMTPDEAWQFKQDIGEITKWTGNASDDKLVNSALQNVYRSVKNSLNEAIPGLKADNERYADLLTAEIAAKYRDKIVERSNLLSLPTRLTGYAGAIISGFVTGSPSSVLLGLGAGVIDGALASPAVKSRVAAWLAKTPKEEQERFLNQVPILKQSIERIFGPKKEKLPQSAAQKTSSKITPEKAVSVNNLPVSGVTGEQKITNSTNFERAKTLNPEHRGLETKAFDYIIKNEDKILSDYKAKYGKFINADQFRPFLKSAGYTDGSMAAGVQEPVSYLAKRARSSALKNPGKYVVGTAGGSGVGKTTAAKGIPLLVDLQRDAAMVLDSNFSKLSSAHSFISESEKAGKQFQGIFTYRDFLDSVKNGIIKRMLTNPEEMGRVVPNSVTAGNHIGSFDVIKQLVKEGKRFYFVDNSLGAGNAKLTSLNDLEKKIKYVSIDKLKSEADTLVKKLYENNEPFIDEKGVKHYITKKQYEALLE